MDINIGGLLMGIELTPHQMLSLEKRLDRIAEALEAIGGELHQARLNMPEPQVVEINK